MSERLAEEGSRTVARHKAAKRGVPVQSTIAGVHEKCVVEDVEMMLAGKF
jgi:hypothetical protein